MTWRPDYAPQGATITLTSGSTAFTTAGAALQSAQIQPGDTILLPAKGMTLVIASITGQNAGTLTDPCPAGAAGAGQKLRIRYQPDGSRFTGMLQEMVEALGSGNVEALAGLAGAADKLGYFTGPGQMGLADFSDYARTLLSMPDAAGVWGALGEIREGNLPARLRPTCQDISNGDWNDATENGWYMGLSCANAPNASTVWHIGEVVRHNDQWVTQTVWPFTVSQAPIYRRQKLSGVWSLWYSIPTVEKGTWTPEFRGQDVAGSYIYSVQTGTYLRMGSLCLIKADLYISSVTTPGQGILRIVPMPFPLAVNDMALGVAYSATPGAVLPAGFDGYLPVVTTGLGGSILFRYQGSGGSTGSLFAQDTLTPGTRFIVSGVYEVT